MPGSLGDGSSSEGSRVEATVESLGNEVPQKPKQFTQTLLQILTSETNNI